MGLHIYRVEAVNEQDAVQAADSYIEEFNPYKDSYCSEPFAVLNVENKLCTVTNPSLANQWHMEQFNTIEKLNQYLDETYYAKAWYYIKSLREELNKPPEEMNTRLMTSFVEYLSACHTFVDTNHPDVLKHFINDDWPNRGGISDASDFTPCYGTKRNGVEKHLFLVLCDTED